jgi:hypothetical protein
MMTREEVRTMAAASIDIATHRVNHPILNTLDDEQARSENR